MTKSDKDKFAEIMTGICLTHGKNVSDPLLKIYWRALSRYEFGDVERAFVIHVCDPDGGRFFPKPADIVRIIDGSGETKALQAWTKVESAIRQVGSYKSLAFDDALIHAVIEDMGGWMKLCGCTEEELKFRSNEFGKRYMGYVNNPPKHYKTHLIGFFEAENSSNGYLDHIPVPMLVGDKEKAKRVMLGGVEKVPLLIHVGEVLKIGYQSDEENSDVDMG